MRDSRPIGIFDSGLGGLTIARKLADTLPHESLLYFGDTLRCPYGAREQAEVSLFAQQISSWLLSRDIKLLVIACNTATAAAYSLLQKTLPIPVIGVIESGAQAGVRQTKTKQIGVLATEATVKSEAYPKAIHAMDESVQVFQAASPDSVKFVESMMTHPSKQNQTWLQTGKAVLEKEALPIVEKDCEPLFHKEIDTVILGCTHFPLLKATIQEALGNDITVVSSAEETQKDVTLLLKEKKLEAPKNHEPLYTFVTTAQDIERFKRGGSYIFGRPVEKPIQVGLEELVK